MSLQLLWHMWLFHLGKKTATVYLTGTPELGVRSAYTAAVFFLYP